MNKMVEIIYWSYFKLYFHYQNSSDITRGKVWSTLIVKNASNCKCTYLGSLGRAPTESKLKNNFLVYVYIPTVCSNINGENSSHSISGIAYSTLIVNNVRNTKYTHLPWLLGQKTINRTVEIISWYKFMLCDTITITPKEKVINILKYVGVSERKKLYWEDRTESLYTPFAHTHTWKDAKR